MKVIFLDFDGVINNLLFGGRVYVEEKYIERLKKLIDITGAKVVVTSARKNEFMDQDIDVETTSYYKKYEKKIKELGIEIFDYTPYIPTTGPIDRESEIKAYLQNHPEIEEYVIIEDDFIIQSLMSHQVFIEYSSGIDYEHIEAAANILYGNLGFYPPNYDTKEDMNHRILRIIDYNRKRNNIPTTVK